MDHRAHKRRARKALHERLADRVLYLESPTGAARWALVRLHQRSAVAGELLRGGYAEAHEVVPKAVFLAEAVEPARGALIVTRDMGVWRVDSVMPDDDITVTAEVVRVTDNQLAALGMDPKAEFAGAQPPA